jgi:hypothetical protein
MMTHADFDSILDDCLARMAAGETVDACLREYPRQAAALRPLLDVAVRLRVLPSLQPRADAVRAGQQRMLAALREQRLARDGSISPLSRNKEQVRAFFIPKEGMQTRHVLRFAAAMVLVLLVGTNLAVVSSAGTIPGDPLYGLKRTWEEARLTLTIRERDREQFQQQLVERRQEEVHEMVQQGREGTLDLYGVLEGLGDGRWFVDGLTLVISEQTVIEGELEPGAGVWVRAKVRSDGALGALRVRVRTWLLPPTATGPRETPDDMPNGRLRTATPLPLRTPEPTQLPQSTGAPEPTVTPLPTATPEPAETPEADQAPAPAETPEPEHTPAPTRTSEPDHAPRPTITREPDHEPEPTRTREPDHTPLPTGTREPDHTPVPTRTSETEHTPLPSRTREPDHTPVPTGTPEPEHTPAPTAGLRSSPQPTGAQQGTPTPTKDHDRTPGLTGGSGHLQGTPVPDSDTD